MATNPIQQEGLWQMQALQRGRMALFEALSGRYGITPEMQGLMSQPTFLLPQEEYDQIFGPANKLKSSLTDNFSAMNVGYNPMIDKLGVGDKPQVGAIYSPASGLDLTEVLPHEFSHRYQDVHPLWGVGFQKAFDKAKKENPDLENVERFVKANYPKEKQMQELFAYIYGESNKNTLPETLKPFYSTLMKGAK